PKNLCDGENGQLAVIGLDFLEFEWWKAGNPSEILSTDPSLSFAPYNSSTDTGLYQVRLTHSDPNSCLNEILEFEIPANDIGPQAGTGVSREFCEGETIDLFDLLEGPYDNYGVWEEVTESNALVGNIWLTKGLPEGTYEFTYTVQGLCKDEDKVNLTIDLLPIPDAPLGNPLQEFCAFDQPTVANLVAEGENITWYLQEEGGNALSNSHLLSDSTLYFAEQTVNGCPSGIRFETLVLIEKAIENNEIGPDQAVDRFSLPDPLLGSVPTGGIGPYQYQWQQSPDGQNWENIMGADQ